MRFLKNKIAKASGLILPPTPQPETPLPKPIEPIQSHPKRPSALRKPKELESNRPKPSQSPPSTKKQLSGDNIMKNYGRAMTNFALSTMAKPYLKGITEKLGISLESFQQYIKERKKSANCIKQLRAMLPLGSGEDEENFELKTAFQKICIIFLKFFVANWLYGSKICEKVIHLKYRFKIMRRVKNPQYFTYLKDFNHNFM